MRVSKDTRVPAIRTGSHPALMYEELDTRGFIMNRASRASIIPPWTDVIETVQKVYRKAFGNALHSVYVRGSVARGTARIPVSDLDTMALVTLGRTDYAKEWSRTFEHALREVYPWVPRVEMIADPLSEVLSYRETRIALTTQAVCVGGTDILPTLPPLKPGRDVVLYAWTLHTHVTDFLAHESQWDDRQWRSRCHALMKRMLRTGAELAMERRGRYTRDLFTCYWEYAQVYPDQEPLMKTVLNTAFAPAESRGDVRELLRVFTPVLTGEIERVFGIPLLG